MRPSGGVFSLSRTVFKLQASEQFHSDQELKEQGHVGAENHVLQTTRLAEGEEEIAVDLFFSFIVFPQEKDWSFRLFSAGR